MSEDRLVSRVPLTAPPDAQRHALFLLAGQMYRRIGNGLVCAPVAPVAVSMLRSPPGCALNLLERFNKRMTVTGIVMKRIDGQHPVVF